MKLTDPELDALAEFLKRKPATARQIAAYLGCSVPTAYVRVRALMKRGDFVYAVKAKTMKRGPRAEAYGVNTEV